ncbi:COG4315 family predicted lipoprotein [Saccharopolyspora sp. NPDC003762]
MPMRAIAVLATGACMITIAACGTSEQPGAQPQPAATPAPAATVVGTRTAPTGDYLVDASGRTLYLFTKDEPNTSRCEGPCAANWPPLSGIPQAGPGVDLAKLGTVNRPDGSRQITFAGKPLYYFAEDMAAGDVKGQDKMHAWYLVSPNGEAIKTAAPTG